MPEISKIVERNSKGVCKFNLKILTPGYRCWQKSRSYFGFGIVGVPKTWNININNIDNSNADDWTQKIDIDSDIFWKNSYENENENDDDKNNIVSHCLYKYPESFRFTNNLVAHYLFKPGIHFGIRFDTNKKQMSFLHYGKFSYETIGKIFKLNDMDNFNWYFAMSCLKCSCKMNKKHAKDKTGMKFEITAC